MVSDVDHFSSDVDRDDPSERELLPHTQFTPGALTKPSSPSYQKRGPTMLPRLTVPGLDSPFSLAKLASLFPAKVSQASQATTVTT